MPPSGGARYSVKVENPELNCSMFCLVTPSTEPAAIVLMLLQEVPAPETLDAHSRKNEKVTHHVLSNHLLLNHSVTWVIFQSS